MSNKKTTQRNGGERGNALFLILIAVALFAALSYAITSSGRGSGSVDKETSMIAAGAIVQYPAGLRTAVTRMIITGTPATGSASAVSVAAASGATNQLFDPAGGGAIIQTPNPTAIDTTMAPATWVFVDAAAVTNGIYIQGVGTDGVTSSRDVVATLGNGTNGGVTLPVCQAILKGLGKAAFTVPTTNTTAVMTWAAAAAAETAFATGSANSLAFATSTATNTGDAFLCFKQFGTSFYNYYHVLIEG